jgi:hypothetical protein
VRAGEVHVMPNKGWHARGRLRDGERPCPGEAAVSENEAGGFFNIMLEIDAQASENKKRLAERFDAACLRGKVAAISEVFAVDEQLSP